MELELKFAELACCEPVGDLITTQEESMETAIPEYCPDIARIVDTVGQLRLREKHPAGQQLTMGGSVVLTVLYTSEESAGLRSLRRADQEGGNGRDRGSNRTEDDDIHRPGGECLGEHERNHVIEPARASGDHWGASEQPDQYEAHLFI